MVYTKKFSHLAKARAAIKRTVSERSPGSPRTMRSPAPLGTRAFPQSSNTVYSPTARFNGTGSPSFVQVAKSPRNTYSSNTTRSVTVQRLSFMSDMDVRAPNVPDIASTINTGVKPLCSSPVISYRHRTRFSDLKTKDEKMKTIHDIGKVVGGDLVGAMKFALKNSKTVGQSLCLNAPERLQEELLEAFREECPKKSLTYIPIEHAVMLQSDLGLSDNKWDLLRKWLPELIQPSKHIVDHCARSDPVIVPIYDEPDDANGNVVAHRVKHVVADLIVPEIEHLLDSGYIVPDKIKYKCGGDSMGMESKNGQTMFVEQFMLTLLIEGRDFNNYMVSNPVAIALGHKEDYNTLKIMNRDIDPSLPRGDFSVVVRGRRFKKIGELICPPPPYTVYSLQYAEALLEIQFVMNGDK